MIYKKTLTTKLFIHSVRDTMKTVLFLCLVSFINVLKPVQARVFLNPEVYRFYLPYQNKGKFEEYQLSMPQEKSKDLGFGHHNAIEGHLKLYQKNNKAQSAHPVTRWSKMAKVPA